MRVEKEHGWISDILFFSFFFFLSFLIVMWDVWRCQDLIEVCS